MARDFEVQASKVPEVTLGFWMIKILATTLGETAGDTVTMTWLKADVMVNTGYLVGSAIFLSVLIVLVAVQIAAKRFHPFLYWATIVASTTCRHDDGRLCHPLAGHRLYWRLTAPVHLPDDGAGTLVPVGGHHLGEHGEHAAGRGLLLGGDYIFADARNRPWRLDRRYAVLDTEAGRWSLAPDWRSLPLSTTGRVCRGSCCSGPPSF